MEYNFNEIEKKWQQYWKDNNTYKVDIDENKPKFYVLDMFPYPSGAGLHVGHPLGYIASDIYARYKRQRGFNVLHPMGYDAYGLPAEQYAIQTGQHPEITTNENIARYRQQLDKIGFCYDWDREVRTCEPGYYKWTQWAFLQMFKSYYNTELDKARPIEELVAYFEKNGSNGCNAHTNAKEEFTAAQWNAMSPAMKSQMLMNYRIAYLGNTMVNWCPQLGTVLANDEVSEGLSIRGGYPVEQKVMSQWCLRVSAYAGRLLRDLDTIEWSDSIKETQKNWIGYSEGAEMLFPIVGSDEQLLIFTTRADTIFGVTFMVLAPESEYVSQVVTAQQREAVDAYLDEVKHKTERERLIEKKVSGVFSGSYAINPVTGKEIPIYISDYVLAGYGTGAIMAVPAHDSRDYAFARHFDLPIVPLIEGADVSEDGFSRRTGKNKSVAMVPTTISKAGVGSDQARWTGEKGAGEVEIVSANAEKNITPEENKALVDNDTITDALARYEVHEGDVFFIPAGRIHAIGAGCFVAEIQQTSDVTYRIYDFKRKDKDGNYRELHTALAAESIDYTVLPNYRTEYEPRQNEGVQVVSCPYFTTSVYDLTEPMTLDYSELDSFVILIAVKGAGSITADGETISFQMGDTVLLPATTNEVRVDGSIKFLETFV